MASKLALEENTRRINELTLDDLLSTYTTTLYSGGTGTAITNPAVSAGDVYIPEFGNGTDLSLVMSLDLGSPVPAVASSAVLSSWCRVYMNQDSLYLSSDNNWLWIEPMVNAAMPQGNPEPRTAVHKFAIDPTTGKPFYRGSGIVDGWLNDRFSMSDYQGYLRIGTTRGGWWGEGISNQLTILGEAERQPRINGHRHGNRPRRAHLFHALRPGPGLHGNVPPDRSALYLRPERPREPAARGRNNGKRLCDVHPSSGRETRLLTIGQSADSTGRVNGNKLQLFDVSDLSAPTLLCRL